MKKHYSERDLLEMDRAGNHYGNHVMAMTAEQLHLNSDIAAELGWRDMQIAALKAERDALAMECAQYKSLAERFAERADDYKSGHFGYSVFDSSNEFKQHIKTPATDAYLNSVRADAVNHAGKMVIAMMNHQDKGVERALECIAEVELQYTLAAKLRAGEPS